MTVDERLAELGLALPPVPRPVGGFLPAKRIGDLLYCSGQTPMRDGEVVVGGKLGRDVDVAEGQQAARMATLNCLAAAADALGGLGGVREVVRLTGYVASAEGFGDQPAVIDGGSQLLHEVFGARGQHARSALGVAELPFGAAVEVELIVAVEPGREARAW